MDRPLSAAIAAASDAALVSAIVALGDERLLSIARQLGRRAAVAQAKRSSPARKAGLAAAIVQLLSTAPDGIGRHELYRHLRCRAKDLDDALYGLAYRRVVRAEQQPSRGRTGCRYYLA